MEKSRLSLIDQDQDYRRLIFSIYFFIFFTIISSKIKLQTILFIFLTTVFGLEYVRESGDKSALPELSYRSSRPTEWSVGLNNSSWCGAPCIALITSISNPVMSPLWPSHTHTCLLVAAMVFHSAITVFSAAAAYTGKGELATRGRQLRP